MRESAIVYLIGSLVLPNLNATMLDVGTLVKKSSVQTLQTTSTELSHLFANNENAVISNHLLI